MVIKKMMISALKPAPYNPRVDLKPGDAEYDKIKNSLDEFDLVLPLVWNERTGNLVGGHQRLKVLEDRGELEVDVSVVNLSEAEEKVLNIALNKVSGVWEPASLITLLDELAMDSAVSFPVTGFGSNYLEEIQSQFDPGSLEAAVEEFTQEMEKRDSDGESKGPFLSFGNIKMPITADECDFLVLKYQEFQSGVEYQYSADEPPMFVEWLFGI
ncbi:MAG: hypothetical protein KDH96_02675 [Candidatus Riesia sp.]|nr:hypothetical protein [Candidatus Riesia sp.]